MAYVSEETQYDQDNFDDEILLSVLEPEENEDKEPWGIIQLSVDTTFRYNMTPDELERLGVWLIAQSVRIKREYEPTGKKKA